MSFSAPPSAAGSLLELTQCIVWSKFIELCQAETHPSPLDDLLLEDAPDQSDGDCYGDHVRCLCGADCGWCELDAIEAAGGEWVVVV